MHTKLYSENLKGRDRFRDRRIWKLRVKVTLNKQSMGVWIVFIPSTQGRVQSWALVNTETYGIFKTLLS